MEVTTYFLTEHEESFSEPDEWKEKVTELGLEGQASLMEGDVKSPIPFMAIEEDLYRILNMVCPRHSEITDYDAQPIPLEALSTVGLAMKENYFDVIEVWSNDSDPDPIIVGRKKVENADRRFLLAQWGPVKKSLTDLRERAIEMWIPKATAKLKSDITDCQSKLERLKELAEMHFNGDYVGIYV